MVAFINDKLTVPGDQIRHFTLADEALDQRDIDFTGRFPTTSTDYPDGSRIN